LPAHLVAIAVGPVQDFIASARRTRDLWLGSAILVAVSRAVANAVRARKGRLIFPAQAEGKGIPNVVLAELPQGDPADVAREAKQAAQDEWKRFAARAREEAGEWVDARRWDSQVDDVVEFYAAWAPFAPHEYATARRDVMRLLMARKTCRNFKPAQGFEGVPKSSLDGARESVWVHDFDADRLSKRLARRLRLSTGEQLDAVGLTKRLGAEQNYPSVSRIAADPWLRGVGTKDAAALARLEEICRKLGGDLIARAEYGQFQTFPFDGEAVYRNRHKEIEEEAKQPGALAGLGACVMEIEQRGYGAPNPYFATLAADGDRMGRTLSKIDDMGPHRELSLALASFASDAQGIVEKHFGCLVYSGGDDVLAFAPLDQAIPCARALRERFGTIQAAGEHLSLSVGVAIGHFMDPLEDHLKNARDAEKLAKAGDRDPFTGDPIPGTESNGLAIQFHPHSGAPLTLRAQWSRNPDQRLPQLAELHLSERIPDRAAFQLRELSRAYENWPRETESERRSLRTALRADVFRLIRRKRRRAEDEQSPLEGLCGSLETAQDAFRFAQEIILARRLAAVIRQARGGRP